MSKHIIRIIVTLLILSALGYVAWNFFIKPHSNQYVYANMITLLEKQDEEKLEKKLKEVKENNYFGSGSKKVQITHDDGYASKLISAYDFTFNINSYNYENYYDYPMGEGFVTYSKLSYANIGEILKEALNYYMPYTQFAKNVTDEDITQFKTLLKSFNTSYDQVIVSADAYLAHLKTYINVNETVKQNAYDYYKGLLNSLTSYYKNYSDLITYLQNFVAKRSADNKFVYDMFSIYYNSAVYSIKYYVKDFNFKNVDFTKNSIDEVAKYRNNYLAESVLYVENYNLLVENNAETDYKLLNVYNTLSKNYSEILFGGNNIFTKPTNIKNKIINKDSSATNSIKSEYLNDVVYLITKLLINEEFEQPNQPSEPAVEYDYVWHTSSTENPAGYPNAEYTGNVRYEYEEKFFEEGSQPAGWYKIGEFGIEDGTGKIIFAYRNPNPVKTEYQWKYVKGE